MKWTGMRGLSLHVQLLLLALIAALTGLVGVGVFLVNQWGRQVDEAYDRSMAIARQVAGEVDASLLRDEMSFSKLVARPRVRTLDPADCDPLLSELVELRPDLTSITVRRLDSSLVCSSLGNATRMLSPAEAQRLRIAVQSGRLEASGVQVGEVTRRKITRLSFPIRDANGVVAGVLLAPVNLLGFAAAALRAVPSDTVVTVADREGAVVMRSQDMERWLGEQLPARILEHFPGVEGTHRVQDLRGVVRLGAYTTSQRTGWRVAVGYPEDEVTGPILKRLYWTGAAALALLSLIVLGAIRVASAIELPLRELESAARRVGAGDWSVRVLPRGSPELASLARRFNDMLDTLVAAREEHAAMERHVESLIRHARDMVLLAGQDQLILEANEAAIAAYGYSVHELRSMRMQDLRDPATEAPVMTAEMLAAVPDGALYEEVHRRKDGTTFPVEISSRVLYVENRSCIQSFIRDITRRRRAEDAMRKFNLELESKVEQRTAQLAEARDHAQQATEAKSAFLAGMSHEIRTPLNAIIGYSHLLRFTRDPNETQRRARAIESASQHLLEVINDVLDLSKIEARRMQLEVTDFDLRSLLGEVRSLAEMRAQGKELVVTAELPPQPRWLRGDPVRLRQALLNYAGNAVKFTEHGSVHLRVVDERSEAGRVLLRFEVIDTGVGIPESARASLFRSFEQGDLEVYRKYGGTGLGLAITRSLAELMGGTVGVESVVGSGSMFWFTAWLQPGEAVARLATAGESLAALRKEYPSARILLVDDSQIGTEVTRELLQEAGLAVECANDGPQALQRASAALYDIVLMDMQMPGMDGLEATRRIRALPGWAKRPIIALTANSFVDNRQSCLDAGMDDFLGKPMDPDRLYHMLLSWLRRSGTVAPPLPSPQTQAPPAPPAPQAAAEARLAALAETTGMEGQRVRFFAGKAPQYFHLAQALVRGHADDVQCVRADLAEGNLAQAVARIHGLKGDAAMLGAHALRVAAADLELELRRLPQAPCDPCPVELELEAVAESLETLRAALAYCPST